MAGSKLGHAATSQLAPPPPPPPAAHAAPCCPLFAGSLTLDLLSTSGTNCESNAIALCLSSFSVNIDTSCNVQVAPLLADKISVPGIWSANPGATYKRLMACPTWARAAVGAAGGASADAPAMRAAIELAIEQAIYGSAYPLGVTATWSSGTLSLATATGSCTLKYAVTSVRRRSLEC